MVLKLSDGKKSFAMVMLCSCFLLTFNSKTMLMKRIFFLLAVLALAGSSCRLAGKRVKGNGNLTTEDRPINKAQKIKLSSSYEVEITQGPVTSVKVEADDNLLPYILTKEENGFLVISSKRNVNISAENSIKVYITTPKLEQVNISGSGNVTGKSKFTDGDKLTLNIGGSGDIWLEVNTPEVHASIGGSGNMTLKGETKNETISIAGSGNYTADELKAENAKVNIAGNGDVKVYADISLDISIAGSGSIYYKGAATVKQHVLGSGEVKKIE